MNLFEHYLPRARAWLLSPVKQLGQWLAGIHTALVDTFIAEIDAVYLDQFADTTRDVARWEISQGLLPLTGDRSRLAARFQAQGGQSPKYIQDTLRAAGFDVYIHEWWDPYTLATRDPRAFLSNGEGSIFKNQFGRVSSQFGRVATQFGAKETATGYALVNKPRTRATVLPDDPNTFPYFMYVGGQIFPFPAIVPLARKEEFERLLLTICPTRLWIGLLISYSAPPTEFITLEDGTGYLLLENGQRLGLE